MQQSERGCNQAAVPNSMKGYSAILGSLKPQRVTEKREEPLPSSDLTVRNDFIHNGTMSSQSLTSGKVFSEFN